LLRFSSRLQVDDKELFLLKFFRAKALMFKKLSKKVQQAEGLLGLEKRYS
jgi:hypothetical protein